MERCSGERIRTGQKRATGHTGKITTEVHCADSGSVVHHMQKVGYFIAKCFLFIVLILFLVFFSVSHHLPRLCPKFSPSSGLLATGGKAAELGWRSALRGSAQQGAQSPVLSLPSVPICIPKPPPSLSVKETTQASCLPHKEVACLESIFKANIIYIPLALSLLSGPSRLVTVLAYIYFMLKRKEGGKKCCSKDARTVWSLEISVGFQQSHRNTERDRRKRADKRWKQALGSEHFITELKE